MEHAPGHADPQVGKAARFFQQGRAQKAHRSPGQAVEEGGEAREQSGGQKEADEGHGSRLPPAPATEQEQDDQIGQAHLHPGHGHKGRQQAFHIGEYEGQRRRKAQGGELFRLHPPIPPVTASRPDAPPTIRTAS